MFKYNDKVRIIKDDQNGFYTGLEGIVKDRVIDARFSALKLSRLLFGRGEIHYEVWLGDKSVYCTEDYLEKIDIQ